MCSAGLWSGGRRLNKYPDFADTGYTETPPGGSGAMCSAGLWSGGRRLNNQPRATTLRKSPKFTRAQYTIDILPGRSIIQNAAFNNPGAA